MPDDYAETWRLFAFWCREGRLCMDDGRYGAAATAYTQAINHAPTMTQLAAVIILRDHAKDALQGKADCNGST